MSETLYGLWITDDEKSDKSHWWDYSLSVWFTDDIRVACAQRRTMIAREFYPFGDGDYEINVRILGNDGQPIDIAEKGIV